MNNEVFETVIDGQKYTFRVAPCRFNYWASAYKPGHSAPCENAKGNSQEDAILKLVKLLEK